MNASSEDRKIHVPLAGPPQVERPSPEIFEAMGEANVYRMLADFYDELEKSKIRTLFPEDMAESSRKSGAFFIGLLGGPPRYNELYGHPALRARHLPFRIDEAARQVWLHCFDRILDDAETYGFPVEHIPAFRNWLQVFSEWMVNTAPQSDV
jgi:hemoglobin